MAKESLARAEKERWPILAICYDFDKTLSPDDMQAQGYIQAVGQDVPEFWKRSNSLAENNDMDQNLAYMYLMVTLAEGKVLFTRSQLASYGSKVQLFPGVDGWFERIRQYGADFCVQIEHYIISSGLKEMIEGTGVAQAGAFKKIYASSFLYNENQVAVWPAQVVNYTNKTQFLFRIEKGILDVNDAGVNDFFPPEKIRVPFRNMIYIGDSDTDIPCMKLVNVHGGYSIGVYDVEKKDKTKVYKMMRDHRIKYYAPADYQEGSQLDALVRSIIRRTAANELLEKEYYKCKGECDAVTKQSNAEQQKKTELLIALENSKSFARTHTVIKSMTEMTDWSQEEMCRMIDIAMANRQVRYILTDMDVAAFYRKILSNMHDWTKAAEQVRQIIE